MVMGPIWHRRLVPWPGHGPLPLSSDFVTKTKAERITNTVELFLSPHQLPETTPQDQAIQATSELKSALSRATKANHHHTTPQWENNQMKALAQLADIFHQHSVTQQPSPPRVPHAEPVRLPRVPSPEPIRLPRVQVPITFPPSTMDSPPQQTNPNHARHRYPTRHTIPFTAEELNVGTHRLMPDGPPHTPNTTQDQLLCTLTAHQPTFAPTLPIDPHVTGPTQSLTLTRGPRWNTAIS